MITLRNLHRKGWQAIRSSLFRFYQVDSYVACTATLLATGHATAIRDPFDRDPEDMRESCANQLFWLYRVHVGFIGPAPKLKRRCC